MSERNDREAVARILDQLERELETCDVLKTLAREQADLMKVRDLNGLNRNTELWEETLGRMTALRDEQRAEILALCGDGEPDLDRVASLCGPEEKRRLNALRSRRRALAGELSRQTELNGRLARFCLDLLGDEMAIFRRGVQETAGGTYDDRGERRNGGAGGVVRHQA